MRSLPKVIEFEWDRGNFDKSYEKHGILPKEAEEVFVSEELYVQKDIGHSQKEDRFIVLGTSHAGKKLFVVFTLRTDKIRIVSARRMHRKEVLKYEKAKKDTTI